MPTQTRYISLRMGATSLPPVTEREQSGSAPVEAVLTEASEQRFGEVPYAETRKLGQMSAAEADPAVDSRELPDQPSPTLLDRVHERFKERRQTRRVGGTALRRSG